MSTPGKPSLGPCPPNDWVDALSLLFQHVTADDRPHRVCAALQLLNSGQLAPAGLRILHRDGFLQGAMVSQVLPGASGLIWPPQVRLSLETQADEDLLVRETSAWLRGQGVKLGQAMLDPHEEMFAPPLERNGFTAITHIWVLHHDGMIPPEELAGDERLTFVTYHDPWKEAFHRVLMASFEATLDCPEINGVRTVEEILAGHQEPGVYSPDRWWLALERKVPVGVIMVNALRTRPVWELAYVGLIPGARGKKLGRELVLKVLWEARAVGVSEVELTVDQRNAPAWHVYRKLGFEALDQRRVYMAVWPQRVVVTDGVG